MSAETNSLYDCKWILLGSPYGASISHFLECPSFVGIYENGDFQFDPYQFIKDVLFTLRCGCQWQEQDSLRISTFNFFPINFPMISAPMANTKVVIITAHDVDVNESWNIRYPVQVAAMEETISQMLPGLSKTEVFGYYSPGVQEPLVCHLEMLVIGVSHRL